MDVPEWLKAQSEDGRLWWASNCLDGIEENRRGLRLMKGQLPILRRHQWTHTYDELYDGCNPSWRQQTSQTNFGRSGPKEPFSRVSQVRQTHGI